MGMISPEYLPAEIPTSPVVRLRSYSALRTHTPTSVVHVLCPIDSYGPPDSHEPVWPTNQQCSRERPRVSLVFAHVYEILTTSY
jgi:hypothetical protein